MYLYVDFKIALDFPLVLQYHGGSFSLNIVFLLGESFFFVAFVGGVFVCVFIHLLRSSLVLFILGVLGLWGVSLAGRVIFSSAWGSAVWSVGPVQFI